MAVRRRNESPLDNLADFLKTHWMLILGAILVYPMIVKFMRNAEAKDKVAEVDAEYQQLSAVNVNPAEQQAYVSQHISNDPKILTAARDIMHALGTNKPWWDISGWTEDDEGAFNAILRVSPGKKVPGALSAVYHTISVGEVNEKGRRLKDDCASLLNNNYYKQLIW